MIGARCPKCGLLQMPGPNCKSCGVPLGGPASRPASFTAQVSQPGTAYAPPAPAPTPSAPSEGGFSIGEAIRFGWSTMMSNPGFFVILMLIVGLVYVLVGFAQEMTKESAPILSLVLAIASGVLQIIIGIGLIRISLRFCDNEKGEFSDLFSCLPLFFPYLLASILYGLIVLGGTILLVIPGIIWGIKYMFFSYLIVDRAAGPVESLKGSSAITKGVKGKLFLFLLALMGINLLGAMALLIGLLATIPTSMLATAYVYRKLAGPA